MSGGMGIDASRIGYDPASLEGAHESAQLEEDKKHKKSLQKHP